MNENYYYDVRLAVAWTDNLLCQSGFSPDRKHVYVPVGGKTAQELNSDDTIKASFGRFFNSQNSILFEETQWTSDYLAEDVVENPETSVLKFQVVDATANYGTSPDGHNVPGARKYIVLPSSIFDYDDDLKVAWHTAFDRLSHRTGAKRSERNHISYSLVPRPPVGEDDRWQIAVRLGHRFTCRDLRLEKLQGATQADIAEKHPQSETALRVRLRETAANVIASRQFLAGETLTTIDSRNFRIGFAARRYGVDDSTDGIIVPGHCACDVAKETGATTAFRAYAPETQGASPVARLTRNSDLFFDPRHEADNSTDAVFLELLKGFGVGNSIIVAGEPSPFAGTVEVENIKDDEKVFVIRAIGQKDSELCECRVFSSELTIESISTREAGHQSRIIEAFLLRPKGKQFPSIEDGDSGSPIVVRRDGKTYLVGMVVATSWRDARWKGAKAHIVGVPASIALDLSGSRLVTADLLADADTNDVGTAEGISSGGNQSGNDVTLTDQKALAGTVIALGSKMTGEMGKENMASRAADTSLRLKLDACVASLGYSVLSIRPVRSPGTGRKFLVTVAEKIRSDHDALLDFEGVSVEIIGRSAPGMPRRSGPLVRPTVSRSANG